MRSMHLYRVRKLFAALAFGMAAAGGQAAAQVAPSATEAAVYTGLYAAGQRRREPPENAARPDQCR